MKGTIAWLVKEEPDDDWEIIISEDIGWGYYFEVKKIVFFEVEQK